MRQVDLAIGAGGLLLAVGGVALVAVFGTDSNRVAIAAFSAIALGVVAFGWAFARGFRTED
jgi:membrane protein implicated in regulation of membrane protease activity